MLLAFYLSYRFSVPVFGKSFLKALRWSKPENSRGSFNFDAGLEKTISSDYSPNKQGRHESIVDLTTLHTPYRLNRTIHLLSQPDISRAYNTIDNRPVLILNE